MDLSFTDKKKIRKSFGKLENILNIPDLIEVQRQSYNSFLEVNQKGKSGLDKVFKEVYPIEDFAGLATIEYVDYRFENPKYTFAGKTGSSQVKRFTEAQREAEVKQESLPYKDRDHALFVAFAPYKNPQYAISVLVEHGGSGGKAAAPIAKKVIKKVLERHELRRDANNQIGESV